MANRLAEETSPYLLQHAHNPVDWYPWGDEALGRARAEGKPILLSIGYAACHWCHVMERESFEDGETARYMNEHFVNVKVDREERPDLDTVYMTAVQAMTGHGGWPMTVFLTPDGKPFYGGTYYPPEPRHGMPAFRQVLEAIVDAWGNRRDEIETKSGELVEYIARASQLRASPQPLSAGLLQSAATGMLRSLDIEWGGFGTGMKFPQPPSLEFLLRMHVVHGTQGALPALTLTLDRMARGGIFDVVGGGFHRYAVDRMWLVPHFEKMLYDNGQLLRLYARAWQVTGSPLYRETALATAEWMLREMRHHAGGFFSSLDADSEGVEGKFYAWTYEELIAETGDDMPIAIALFAASGSGNWEGTNVLWRPQTDEEVSQQTSVPLDELRAATDRIRASLFAAREKRVRPGTDDKVLAAWNGLAIAGLAEAGRIFGRPDLVRAASDAAGFVLSTMRHDGRLLRSWRDGVAGRPGFLDDHALMADACLTLYEATFDARWFDEAMQLAGAMLALFRDPDNGGFFDTGTDADEIVVRPKDVFDNAMPSGNAAASDVLLRLAATAGEPDLERAAVDYLRTIAPALAEQPLGFGAALQALDRSVSRAQEVAIVGAPDGEDTRALLDVAFERYLPNRVVALGSPGTTVPALLRDRPLRDGRATAYVCRDFMCREPVIDPEALRAQLAS